MRLFISLTLCIIAAGSMLHGQSNLGVAPFTFEPSKVSAAEASQLYAEVLSEIMNVSPISVVGGASAWGFEVAPRGIKPGDVLALDGLKQKARDLNTGRVIMGHILDIDKSNFGIPNPVMHIWVLDIENNTTLHSSIVSKTGVTQVTIEDGKATSETQQKADEEIKWTDIQKVWRAAKLQRKDALQVEIRNFFNEALPPQLPIIGLEATKGESALSFTIAGSPSLFQKGQSLEVIQWTVEGGYNRRKVLAGARVSSVEGQIIVCSVTGKEGQSTVYKMFNAPGVFVTPKSK